jgi:hypothetical protein
MARHGRASNQTPDTPEQKAAWLDASWEANKAVAEAKREADPSVDLQPLVIKGDNNRGGNIGISADGKHAKRKS